MPDVDALQVNDRENKIVATVHAKQRNACSYTIAKEDHTIGGLLWSSLLTNPDVLFAGYKVPHPLEEKIVLKVETSGERVTPKKAVKKAIDQVSGLFTTLEDSFKFEMSTKFVGDRGSAPADDFASGGFF